MWRSNFVFASLCLKDVQYIDDNCRSFGPLMATGGINDLFDFVMFYLASGIRLAFGYFDGMGNPALPLELSSSSSLLCGTSIVHRSWGTHTGCS